MRPDAGAGPGDPEAAPIPLRWTAAYVIGILAALLAWDLVYFAHGEYRGVAFDAVSYYQQSHELLHQAWRALGLTAVIDRAYGPLPTMKGLVDWAMFQGIGYPAYLAAVQFVIGEGVTQARLANAGLHLGSALLVWRLGVLLGGRLAGLLSMTLFALYVPFTYMAAVLLTENLAAFLVLLVVWSGVSFLRTRGRGRAVAFAAVFGLGLILLPLSRPALAPFSLAMLLVWTGAVAWRWLRERSGHLLAGAVVAVVLAVVPYLAWQQVVVSVAGLDRFTFSVAGPRTIKASLYESYDWKNGGWPRPAGFTASLQGRLLRPPSVLDSIREGPAESALLRVEKFYRLWKGPATAYANPLWGGVGPVKALHGAVVVAGLLGLLFFRPSSAWLLAALPVAYTAAVYTLYFSEERRFIFPVMSLLLVFAALAAIDGWKRLRQPERAPPGIRGDLLWAAGLLVAGLYVTADGFVVHPALNPRLVHGVMSVVFAGCLAVGTWRVTRLLWGERGSRASVWRSAVATGLLAVPVGVHLVHFADWYSWKVTLRDPAQRVVQVFVPPPGLDWGRVRIANLQIDAYDPDGQLDNLEVRVNGQPQTRLVSARLMPASYRHVEEELGPRVPVNWEWVDVAPRMNQWLIYRLDPARLAGSERLVTVVGLNREPRSADEVTTISGEFRAPDPRTQLGPRPALLPADARYLRVVPFNGRASLWRYQTYGDMRIHGGTRLIGAHRSAYMSGPGDADAAGPPGDLSPAPFRQTGAYRIRLQLITDDGVELFL